MEKTWDMIGRWWGNWWWPQYVKATKIKTISQQWPHGGAEKQPKNPRGVGHSGVVVPFFSHHPTIGDMSSPTGRFGLVMWNKSPRVGTSIPILEKNGGICFISQGKRWFSWDDQRAFRQFCGGPKAHFLLVQHYKYIQIHTIIALRHKLTTTF